jgi:hypothetical protein
MSIEAMRQALEALEQINKLSIGENAIALPGEIDAAMDNLRAVIEQGEKQEPVAWRWKEVKGEFVGDWVLTEIEPPPYVTESMPLYTAPRQWVELTDDEARALVNRATFGDKTNWQALVYMVDAKLKEKNT